VPHPKGGYRLKDGTKVPGATTIIGRFKESGALIAWAYNRGRDGLELYESRDKAAELGTIAHDMVESFVKGKDPMDHIAGLLSEDTLQVLSAYEAFREWFDNSKLEIIEQEMQLVSEVYKFGGTPDAVARDSKGRLCLIDFKTSNGVYQDYLYQLGFYRILWNENRPDMPLTGGSHIARFAKEHGDFAHHYFPNIDEAERGAILMAELYAIDKGLKKRV
jgi:hypothetical protein